MFWVPSGLESSIISIVELSFKFWMVWIMSAMFSASQYVGRIIATCGLVFVSALFTVFIRLMLMNVRCVSFYVYQTFDDFRCRVGVFQAVVRFFTSKVL